MARHSGQQARNAASKERRITTSSLKVYEQRATERRKQRAHRMHPKIVFPDNDDELEANPAAVAWPATPDKPPKRKKKKKQTQTQQLATFRRNYRALPNPWDLGQFTRVPGSNLLVDPMTSPRRLMREWNDDVLAAVWKHSHEHGQVKDLGGEYKLQLRRSTELSEGDRVSCLDIVQHTSMAAYKASRMGWDLSAKRTEMVNSDMAYILVRATDGTRDAFSPDLDTDIVGFISFMIDYDDPPNELRQVVYIFEVHLAEKLRGKGLGKWLMFTVEAMAQSVTIQKTMLTVFVSNKDAIQAYKQLGYDRDEASPPDRKTRRKIIQVADYWIMSKSWHGK
jgi:GNAT superfamily N-acetyltransferase